MRKILIICLIATTFTGILCKDLDDDEGALGTSENPLPEDHDSEDAEDAENEPGDEEGESDYDSDDEEGEDHPDAQHLQAHEDNGEGQEITEQHLRALHTKLDKDGNGKVHIDEVMTFAAHTRKSVAGKEIEGILNEIDSTKDDGHMSLEEHLAESAEFHEGDDEEKDNQKNHDIARFKIADVNGDGRLDKEELISLMHPDTHPEMMDLVANEEMRKKDANKDGKLTQAEWGDDEETAKDFPKIDANGDGVVDLDELTHYESGRFHTEEAMKKLMEVVDKDNDNHFTADELLHIVDKLDGHDAHPHLLEWVFHEEL